MVIEIPPITHDRAIEMIHSLKAGRVLNGARGTKPADIGAVARILVGLGDFAIAYRDYLKELDINPILVRPAGEGASVVDVFVELRPEV